MSRILIPGIVAATLIMVITSEVAPFATGVPDAMGVPDTLPTRQIQLEPTRDTGGAVPDLPVEAWVTTALERPLFRENRRPAKLSVGAVQTAGTVRLAGVMTGSFGRRAIFISTANNKPVVVGEGARVGDFTVRTIGPGMAIIETDGGVRTLRPSFTGHESSNHP